MSKAVRPVHTWNGLTLETNLDVESIEGPRVHLKGGGVADLQAISIKNVFSGLSFKVVVVIRATQPGDADTIVRLNIAQLQASPGYKDIIKRLLRVPQSDDLKTTFAKIIRRRR